MPKPRRIEILAGQVSKELESARGRPTERLNVAALRVRGGSIANDEYSVVRHATGKAVPAPPGVSGCIPLAEVQRKARKLLVGVRESPVTTDPSAEMPWALLSSSPERKPRGIIPVAADQRNASPKSDSSESLWPTTQRPSAETPFATLETSPPGRSPRPMNEAAFAIGADERRKHRVNAALRKGIMALPPFPEYSDPPSTSSIVSDIRQCNLLNLGGRDRSGNAEWGGRTLNVERQMESRALGLTEKRATWPHRSLQYPHEREARREPVRSAQWGPEPKVFSRRRTHSFGVKALLLIGCLHLYAVVGGFMFGPVSTRFDTADGILLAIGAAYFARAAWIHSGRRDMTLHPPPATQV